MNNKSYNYLQALKVNRLMFIPRRWNNMFRSWLACHPKLWYLYKLYILWDQIQIIMQGKDNPSESLVRSNTSVVIDGYGGSANTFATAAFRNSQTVPVELAHHLHSPVQIINAVKKGIPTIVVIRDPRGATLSVITRWPHVSMAQALRNYTRFYTTIKPYAYGYVISTFDRTTKHFDEVIIELNKQFCSRFAIFEKSEKMYNSIRKPEVLHSESWKDRQEQKKFRAKEFDTKECQKLLSKADSEFRHFVAISKIPAEKRRRYKCD
jgi:hypothetical protein